MIRWISL